MLGTWKMDQNSSQNKSEVYQTIDIVEPGTLTWQHMYSLLGNGDSGEGSVAAVTAVFVVPSPMVPVLQHPSHMLTWHPMWNGS